MMAVIVVLACTLLFSSISDAQQRSTPASNSAAKGAAQNNACKPQLSEAERGQLESDLQKMRVLVDQMQMNLAAAVTGETPMKRQFQLDIEMWQLLLRRLETNVGASRQRE